MNIAATKPSKLEADGSFSIRPELGAHFQRTVPGRRHNQRTIPLVSKPTAILPNEPHMNLRLMLPEHCNKETFEQKWSLEPKWLRMGGGVGGSGCVQSDGTSTSPTHNKHNHTRTHSPHDPHRHPRTLLNTT